MNVQVPLAFILFFPFWDLSPFRVGFPTLIESRKPRDVSPNWPSTQTVRSLPKPNCYHYLTRPLPHPTHHTHCEEIWNSMKADITVSMLSVWNLVSPIIMMNTVPAVCIFVHRIIFFNVVCYPGFVRKGFPKIIKTLVDIQQSQKYTSRDEIWGSRRGTENRNAKETQRKEQVAESDREIEENGEKRLRAVNQTRESQTGQTQHRACAHTGGQWNRHKMCTHQRCSERRQGKWRNSWGEVTVSSVICLVVFETKLCFLTTATKED